MIFSPVATEPELQYWNEDDVSHVLLFLKWSCRWKQSPSQRTVCRSILISEILNCSSASCICRFCRGNEPRGSRLIWFVALSPVAAPQTECFGARRPAMNTPFGERWVMYCTWRQEPKGGAWQSRCSQWTSWSARGTGHNRLLPGNIHCWLMVDAGTQGVSRQSGSFEPWHNGPWSEPSKHLGILHLSRRS